MPCRFPGPPQGGSLRGLQAHTQGGSWGVWPGGVSRPTTRGAPCQQPGGSPGPQLGGCLQAHTQGGIPAYTEADPLADGYCRGRYASYWNAFLFHNELTALTSCHIDHRFTAIRVYIQVFVISVDMPFKPYQMLERHIACWAPTNYKQSKLLHINDCMKKKSQTICDDKSAKETSLFIYHCENFECLFCHFTSFGIFDMVVTIFKNGRTKYISWSSEKYQAFYSESCALTCIRSLLKDHSVDLNVPFRSWSQYWIDFSV